MPSRRPPTPPRTRPPAAAAAAACPAPRMKRRRCGIEVGHQLRQVTRRPHPVNAQAHPGHHRRDRQQRGALQPPPPPRARQRQNRNHQRPDARPDEQQHRAPPRQTLARRLERAARRQPDPRQFLPRQRHAPVHHRLEHHGAQENRRAQHIHAHTDPRGARTQALLHLDSGIGRFVRHVWLPGRIITAATDCGPSRTNLPIHIPEPAETVTTTKEEKAAVRAAVGRVLAGLDAARAATHSAAACALLESLDNWLCARTLLVYMPMQGEVDIGPSVRLAIQAGKVVCLPRTDWAIKSMTPARVETWGAGLVPGRHGVMEPDPALMPVRAEEIDLVIVPGAAFDPHCWRLGRGAGFYDRFLARPDVRAAKIGVAFDEQIVPAVPRDEHDVRLDMVVTPSRVL